jgi:GNAT superfamily N-acetyltransferase
VSPVIRPATGGDARAMVDVRLASWRATYGPLLPAGVWDGMDPGGMAERWAPRLASGVPRALVAEVDGAVVRAYALFGPSRDEDLPHADEIYAIYAHPDSFSTGLGRALMAASLAQLRRPVTLWVLEQNPRARRFYEIAGFRPDGARKPAEMPGGVELPELRYRLGEDHD